jgi:putative peptidoglycan lipid II flippase
MALSALYTGYLQCYGKFIQPSLTGIVANLIIIFGIVVFARFGIKAAVIASFIGAFSQMVVQRPFMTGYKHKFFIDLKDDHIKKMFMLAGPMLIYSGVSQVNLMVGTNFASHLAVGSISVVDYATKISTLINQVFIASITMVVYPSLTEKYANDDKLGFQSLINKSINSVMLVAIPLTFGMAVLSSPLVRILLQHGKFDANAASLTSMCLKYLAIASLGYSLTDILGKIFYAANDTLTPMINGFINVGLNVLFIIIFVPLFDVKGIALATTVSTIAIAVIMIIEIKLKLKYIKLREFMNTSAKIILSGLVMVVICKISFSTLSVVMGDNIIYSLVKLAVSTVIGAVIYIAMLLLLKVDDIYNVIPAKLLSFGKERKK